MSLLFSLDITPKKLCEFGFPVGTPWKRLREHLRQRLTGIDTARIDREAGILLRESPRRAAELLLVTDDIDHIRRITAVEDRKRRVQADISRVAPEQPIRNGMKSAGPRQQSGTGRGTRPDTRHAPDDGFRPARHVRRRAPRECQQQDLVRVPPQSGAQRDARASWSCRCLHRRSPAAVRPGSGRRRFSCRAPRPPAARHSACRGSRYQGPPLPFGNSP